MSTSGSMRDRSSNNKYYTNAEQETQPQAGPRVSRGIDVLIENKPQINVTTNNNLQDRWSLKYTIVLALVVVVCVAGCFLYKSDNTTVAKDDQTSRKETSVKRTPIDIDNPETIIASKLIEVVDMYKFASCLEIKNSKAVVEQHNKNHRGKVEHVRIEVIDVWLKAADQRYWEDLIDTIRGCMGNERLGNVLSKEFLNRGK